MLGESTERRTQAIAMLQRRGRLTYRALKRQFDLDDAYLDDLKHEIIEGQRLAVDEHGTVLIWTGTADPALTSAAVPERAPLAYTPPHLTEIHTYPQRFHPPNLYSR
jgi:hypothetical protein